MIFIPVKDLLHLGLVRHLHPHRPGEHGLDLQQGQDLDLHQGQDLDLKKEDLIVHTPEAPQGRVHLVKEQGAGDSHPGGRILHRLIRRNIQGSRERNIAQDLALRQVMIPDLQLHYLLAIVHLPLCLTLNPQNQRKQIKHVIKKIQKKLDITKRPLKLIIWIFQKAQNGTINRNHLPPCRLQFFPVKKTKKRS